MGNTPSAQEKKSIKFGSINDPDNSRPGYYNNGKILKYHTDEIPLVAGENIESFKKLRYGYAITNKRAFYKGEPILNVNPSHFGILQREEVHKLNNSSFSKLNSVLGIESIGKYKNVYYKGKLIN
jgi:hypothetical protein